MKTLISYFQEAHAQNEKFAAQLMDLSREALTSASQATMAGKLKDIVSQLSQSPGRAN